MPCNDTPMPKLVEYLENIYVKQVRIEWLTWIIVFERIFIEEDSEEGHFIMEDRNSRFIEWNFLKSRDMNMTQIDY